MLQKLAYLGVIVVLIPLMVLTGLTMSPGMDAAWPWLVDLFGGRQSARSIHFIAAWLLVLFVVVHLVMVVLAGPFNEIRSMITGRYRLPKEKRAMRLITRRRLLTGGLAAPALLLGGCDRLGASPSFREIVLGSGEWLVLPRAAADRLATRWRASSTPRRCRRSSAPTATPSRAPRSGGATPPPASPTGGCTVDGAGRGAGRLLARRAPRDAGAQPDHPPRLRRGLERDRQVDGRAARRSCSARRGCSRTPASSCSTAPTTSAAPPYYESIDLVDAFHPQTILAYGMNDAELPIGHGAPLRLRVERQLGYKHAKFVMRIEAVTSLAGIGAGPRRLLGGRRRLRLVRRGSDAASERPHPHDDAVGAGDAHPVAGLGHRHAGLEPRRPGHAVDGHLALAVVEGDHHRLAAEHLVGPAVQRASRPRAAPKRR